MMRTLIPIFLILSVSLVSAQSRKISPAINQGSVNITAPSISGTGDRLIYLSDYTDTRDLTMMMSENDGGWKNGTILPNSFNRPKINFAYGHYLNFDGNKLYFTTRASGSRGYDIWYVELQDRTWGRPVKLSEVINTSSHEGSPSFTPDEQEIYFMRCTAMLGYNASGCDIYYSKKQGDEWTEPVKLPEYINEGNVQSPRIQADGKTLYYASNKPGGKGKFDMYMTRRSNEGEWSKPIPMDFVNTPEDDIMGALRIYGNTMLKSMKLGSNEQIMEMVVPSELQPEPVILLNYEVDRDYTQRPATLHVQDWDTGEELSSGRIDAGSYKLIVNKGRRYHVMIEPVHMLRSMVSVVIDANGIERPEVKNAKFSVTELKSGRELNIEGVERERLEPYFTDKSQLALSYVARMVKNLQQEIEIELVQTNYMEDSLFSHEDLTETRIDTTYVTRIDTVWLPTKEDSITTNINTVNPDLPDSLGTIEADTILSDAVMAMDSITMKTGLAADTVFTDPEPLFELREVQEVKTSRVYHNDRFKKESEALRQWLTDNGVPDEKIIISKSIEEPAEDKPGRSLRLKIR